MASSSLTDVLTARIDNLSNLDSEWVVFITDHLEVIRNNSIVVRVDDIIRDRFHYKFDHFLRENSCNQSLYWIARLMNELSMYEDFILKPTIMIPDYGFISNLYRRYRTSRNKS